MKKYLLGFMAVLFALGLSAFNHVPEKTRLTDPYWYKVNPIDLKVTAILGQKTKQAAKNAASCQDQNSTLCARGYNIDPGYAIGDVTVAGDDSFNRSN